MATINIQRSHHLGKEGAKREVEQIAQQLKSRLDVDYHWQGDDLIFHRAGADGDIHVEENAVHVKIELGLLLSPMKGMIETQIENHLDSRLK
jgi:putative polyhydroxyalkanoate system protein